MITVTETAAKKIQSNLNKRGHGIGIRIGVRTTGCSGMAYVLEYVDTAGADDEQFEYDNFIIADSIFYRIFNIFCILGYYSYINL